MRLEEVQPAAVREETVDDVRQGADEVVRLEDDGPGDGDDDGEEDGDGRERDQQRGEDAVPAVTLQPADGGLEGDREDDADEHPEQDRADLHEELGEAAMTRTVSVTIAVIRMICEVRTCSRPSRSRRAGPAQSCPTSRDRPDAPCREAYHCRAGL